MKKYIVVLLIVILVIPNVIMVAQTTPREQIKKIANYVVYYGRGRLEDLMKFDLAIIQPDTLTAEEIAKLKANGTLVVSYLSVGEAEPSRAWFVDGRVDPRWLLGKNENWGSYFVDASQPGWQKLMVELTGEFLKKGFDGVFLDTVDTVDAFPETTDGMIALIKQLRQTYPEALLVQNRGFTVIKQLTSDLDALMFEDLITTYNFTTKEYLYTDNSFTANELAKLSKETGLVVLALDYAPPDNPAMAYLSIQEAKKYGFIPAVSTIMLDDIPDYGLAQGGTEDIRIRSIEVQLVGDASEIVVVIENVGLKDATQVAVSLTVDGEQIASTKYDDGMPIGKQIEWRVPWTSGSPTATIRATAFCTGDRKAGNNNKTFKYKAETAAVEPLLPPEQQKRRPADNGPELIATALTAPLTIDGDLSDWADMPCTEVNDKANRIYGEEKMWTGPQDLSGRVCYAWDSEAIYVGFHVVDDAIVQKYVGTDIWRGDHVELWFDTQLQLDFDSGQANQDDFQVGISPGDFDKVASSLIVWTPPTLEERYKVIEYATKRTEDGWAGEVRIPVQFFTGMRLATDNAIGGSFDPSDTDTPDSSEQEYMLSTAPKSTWGVPTLWNNIVLKGEPTQ